MVMNMSVPGHFDPVPVPREVTPRDDGRVDLLGLPKKTIAELFEQAGLDARQAKLRAKQVWHWIYHRGVSEFEAMTDIAKTMRPWLTERFVIARPEIVEAQHSTDGTRSLLETRHGQEDLILIDNPQQRQWAGLNLAAAAATGHWRVSNRGRAPQARRPSMSLRLFVEPPGTRSAFTLPPPATVSANTLNGEPATVEETSTSLRSNRMSGLSVP